MRLVVRNAIPAKYSRCFRKTRDVTALADSTGRGKTHTSYVAGPIGISGFLVARLEEDIGLIKENNSLPSRSDMQELLDAVLEPRDVVVLVQLAERGRNEGLAADFGR